MYFPRLVTYASITAISASPLALDSEDAVQGGGGDPKPLGHRDVIFHRFIDMAPAYYQHTGAPEQVAPHVNTAFMLLRHRVIEEQRQIEHRADGGIPRIVDNTAIFSRLLHNLALAAAPCGGHIRKGSFHNPNLRFFSLYIGRVNPIPRPFPIQGKGAALEDIPPPLAGNSTAGADRKGQAAAKAAGVPPLDGPLPAVRRQTRRRGIYHRRAHPKRGAHTSGQSVQKQGAGHLSSSFFFSGFASSGGCFSFHSSSRAMICSFILAGVISLPKYLLSSSVLMITLSTSLFSSLKMPSITSPLSRPSWSSSRSRFACLTEGEDCSPSIDTAMSRWFSGLIYDSSTAGIKPIFFVSTFSRSSGTRWLSRT
ncbi:hypothetical protein QKU_1453 [Clostridioides difficile DA00203]|nr:hypothetical protein QKU_1453 [Clostridioides difficile DA00203]